MINIFNIFQMNPQMKIQRINNNNKKQHKIVIIIKMEYRIKKIQKKVLRMMKSEWIWSLMIN